MNGELNFLNQSGGHHTGIFFNFIAKVGAIIITELQRNVKKIFFGVLRDDNIVRRLVPDNIDELFGAQANMIFKASFQLPDGGTMFTC